MNDINKVEQAISDFSKRPLGDVKVMMIEDDPFISELVLTKLSQEGCIPYSCNTGDEAIALTKQFMPDVVILDLMLPGMSGEDILSAFKQSETLKTIPVVVFSNKSADAEIEAVMKLGAAEYLVKSSTEISQIPGVIVRVLNK